MVSKFPHPVPIAEALIADMELGVWGFLRRTKNRWFGPVLLSKQYLQ